MKRYVTIIPFELQENANAYCSQFADGGEYTFTSGLSADGEHPETHFVSSWVMNKAEEYAMKLQFEEYMYQTENHKSLLNELGLQPLKSKELSQELTEA